MHADRNVEGRSSNHDSYIESRDVYGRRRFIRSHLVAESHAVVTFNLFYYQFMG